MNHNYNDLAVFFKPFFCVSFGERKLPKEDLIGRKMASLELLLECQSCPGFTSGSGE